MQRRRTTDERRTNDGQRTTLERRTNDERTTNDALTNEVFRWILDFGFRLWTLDSSFGFGFRVLWFCVLCFVFGFWLSGFRLLVFYFSFFRFWHFCNFGEISRFRIPANFGTSHSTTLDFGKLSNFRTFELSKCGILEFGILEFWSFGNLRKLRNFGNLGNCLYDRSFTLRSTTLHCDFDPNVSGISLLLNEGCSRNVLHSGADALEERAVYALAGLRLRTAASCGFFCK